MIPVHVLVESLRSILKYHELSLGQKLQYQSGHKEQGMTKERWGDFEVDLDDRLGSGGMGTVYRARQISVGRAVALKVLPPELNEDSDFVRQFDNEARLAGSLRHESIVAVYGAGREGERPYIAFELVEGVDLASFIATRNTDGQILNDAEIVGIALQTASALAVAHNTGITHRDLKPANLLMTEATSSTLLSAGLGVRLARHRVKISDFGIASGHWDHRSKLLELGSPHYMAPEQMDGAPGDSRSDIYSLGVVCYELLTGQAPFQGTLAEILAGHVMAPVSVPREGHNPSLIALIERCLQKDRLDRYPHAEALVRALLNIGKVLEKQLPEDTVEFDSHKLKKELAKDSEKSNNRKPLAIGVTSALPTGSTRIDNQPAVPAGDDPAPLVKQVARPTASEDETVLEVQRPNKIKKKGHTDSRSASSPLSHRSGSRRWPQLPGPDAPRVSCGADHELFATEIIGEGGMGAVYLGRQISLDRAVAIKVLKLEAEKFGDKNLRERFHRESRLAARLQHPNIVSVLAAGVIEDPSSKEFHQLPYYAMELVVGDDLKECLKAGRKFSLREVLKIMEQTCSGLCAAAELDLVHRDIKPGNLILTEDAGALRVKIADFGLAKDLKAGGMTQRGTVLGSIAYLAPEQITGSLDQRADLYALGVTWYELLTGRLPFHKPTVSAMLRAHQETPAPRVEGIPGIVADVVARCLNKKPDDRYAGPRELLDEIRSLLLDMIESREITSSHSVPTPPITSREIRVEETQFFLAPSRRRLQRQVAILACLMLSAFSTMGASWWGKKVLKQGQQKIVKALISEEIVLADRELQNLSVRHPQDTVLLALNAWSEVLNVQKGYRQRTQGKISRERASELRPGLLQLSQRLGNERPRLPTALLNSKAAGAFDGLTEEIGNLSDRLDRIIKGPSIPKDMRLVPGKQFYMGTQHVRLKTFALDVHEVTWAEYQRFVSAVNDVGHKWCHPSQRGLNKAHSPSDWEIDGALERDLPVVGVDWFDAYAYAQWAKKRLPMEAEWVCAASTTKDPYPWGAKFDRNKLRWFGGPSWIGPGVMALRPGQIEADRGPYGHFDMLGNVREWCGDWFQSFPDSLTELVENPTGPTSGTTKVIRGFSWAYGTSSSILVYHRGQGRPGMRSLDIGFRCAKSLQIPE
jgi:serine/threonine protein kinase/formylglycine-generating enzyme required for sulfatase activity